MLTNWLRTCNFNTTNFLSDMCSFYHSMMKIIIPYLLDFLDAMINSIQLGVKINSAPLRIYCFRNSMLEIKIITVL